jgi:hypothetical protein
MGKGFSIWVPVGMKITVVFSLHFLFLLNNPPALSYVLISVGWFFLNFFKEPVGSSSSKIPESKKHGLQIFKDTRINEFQNQRNTGSSSSKNSRIKETWIPVLQ